MRLLLAFAIFASWGLNYAKSVETQSDTVPLIGVGDKLKLIFYGRPDISGEYLVQAEGVISIPLLGSFRAEGRTISKLSDEIQKAFLRNQDQPYQLVIEVTEWRPIYIMGLVDKPGQYPFKPGLTALQAMALAGGLFRPTTNGVFLGVVRESERIAEAKSQLARAVAQRTRLETELANDFVTSSAPGQTTSNKKGYENPAIADQAHVLAWTQETLAAKLDSKGKEISLSSNEVNSYKRQLEEISEQIRLTKAMLAESQALVDRGLTPRLRIMEIQRIVAGLQAEREQVNAQLARAERSRIQASQEVKTLTLDRKLQAQQELEVINDKIATLQAELRTAQFVTATMPTSPNLVEQTTDGIVIRIVRRDRSESFNLTQAEKMLLKPGDLLMVEMTGGASIAPSSRPVAAGATSSDDDREK
jgi:protein involved in polysaccharide export with SLBB domain